MMKNIAVVLPTYNSGALLDLQINSILIQEGVSVEIYLMDDSSSDETKKKIDDYAGKFKNIYVLEAGRKHGSASQSFFFLLIELSDVLCNFDFVALSDHDDIWLPSKLSHSIDVLDGCGASCYSSNFLSVGYDTSWGLSAPFVSDKGGRQNGYNHYFEGPGPGCTFVLRKNFYIDLVKFISTDDRQSMLNNVYGHDWFMYIYATDNQYKWIIDKSPHMLYLQHDSNETGVNRGLNAYKKRIGMLFSGWYLDQIRTMINIISPESDIHFRLKRMSFRDRLFFLMMLPRLRRKISHAFILGLFFCFAKGTKKEKSAI